MVCGVLWYLWVLGFVGFEEFVLECGKCVDVMVLGFKGEFWVIECKFSCVDF